MRVQALQLVAVHGHGSLVGIVGRQVEGSVLVPFFLGLSPYFVRTFEPWFPGGLPQLLAGVA